MKSRRKNQKGVSLIELLIVIAVVALTMPLLFYVFIDGVKSFNTYSKFAGQQDKVMGVTLRIRKDIEEAEGYKLYSSAHPDAPVSILALRYPLYEEGQKQPVKYRYRYWKFESSKLSVMVNEGNTLNAVGDYEAVVDGLDTSKITVEPPGESPREVMLSGFAQTRGRIVLSIKPVNENQVHKNRNVTKPIIAEYSVDYKNNGIGEF